MRSELKEAIRRIHEESYPKLLSENSRAKRRNGNGKWRLWKGLLKSAKPGISFRVKMLVLFITAAFVFYTFVAGIYYYNRFSVVLVDIQKNESLVDIELKRRANLLPNLLIISAEYRSHEKRLYEHVSEMRSHLTNLNKRASGAAALPLSDLMSSLMAIAEEYPELKATQSFEKLMNDWTETENRIAEARAEYIESVRRLNAFCTTFPSNVYADLFGMTTHDTFSFNEPGAESINSIEFFSAYFGDDTARDNGSVNAAGSGMRFPAPPIKPNPLSNEMNVNDENPK